MEHWMWKYLENPLKRNNITVGEFEDKIIACDHGLYTLIKVGKETFLCRQGVDAAVHPDYRGEGIYKNTDKLKDDMDFFNRVKLVYSVSTNPVILRHREKNKRPTFPYPIAHYIYVSDVNQIVKNIKSTDSIKKWGIKQSIKLAQLYNNLQIIITGKIQTSANLRIIEVERFDREIEVFWNKVKEDYNFITERTCEYLNWRYNDSRGGKYVVKQAVEEGEVIGYVVLRINHYDSDNPRGYVVDLCTFRNRLDCAAALLAEAAVFFRLNQVDLIESMIVKGHPYERVLKQFNYLDDRNYLQVFLTLLEFLIL